jgi:hypothetical protein
VEICAYRQPFVSAWVRSTFVCLSLTSTALFLLERLIIYLLPQRLACIAEVLERDPIKDDILPDWTKVYYIGLFGLLVYGNDMIGPAREALYKKISRVHFLLDHL